MGTADEEEALSKPLLSTQTSPARSPQQQLQQRMSPPDEKSPLVSTYGPRSHGGLSKSSVQWTAETALNDKRQPGVPSDEDWHRCYRSYGSKPFVMASIAIGAGSFAQGCDA